MDTTKSILEETTKITQAATEIAATIVDKAPLDRMKADFQGYFKNTAPGKVLNWCGGTLTKNADGSARYQLPNGTGITFTAVTDLALLYEFPLIKASWDSTYPGSTSLMNIEAIRLSVKNITTWLTPEVIPPPSAEKLVWQTDLAVATSMAKAQRKRILLLGGKKGCSVTERMKDQACESLAPPIKALIEHYFIPWHSEKASAGGTAGYDHYVNGMGMFYLPVICVIDPNDTGTYLARSTGNQNFQVLHDWMLKYAK